MNLCLIPVTRLDLVDNAIKSAESDGWKVITLEDKNKEGPIITREKLFKIAIKENSNLIRYLDDDDTVLPHSEKCIFNDEDIIYTNHYADKNLIKLSGNPQIDTFSIHPWSWIAKTNSLKSIFDKNGFIWNPDIPCREGGWCWYNFLQYGLKFKHISIPGYQWNRTTNTEHFMNHKNFEQYSYLLEKAMYERNR